MRPRLPAAQFDGKQALFLSWLGNRTESNQMTRALSSIFKKAGIEGPVHHTLYRKAPYLNVMPAIKKLPATWLI